MRKVEVYKMVMGYVAERSTGGLITKVSKPIKTLMYVGKFHCFSTDYEVLNQGVGIFPTALIEKEDGTIESISVEMIRLTDGE